MKNLLLILLLVILAGLNYLLNPLSDNQEENTSFKNPNHNLKTLTNQEIPNSNLAYNIHSNIDTEKKRIDINQKIRWVLKENLNSDSLFINFYIKRYVQAVNISRTYLNKESAEVNFSAEQNRSESGFILLKHKYYSGDTIQVELELNCTIPRAQTGFGYNADESFYLFYECFPALAVYEDGVWHHNPNSRFGGVYNSFADYEIEFSFPDKFNLVSSGATEETIKQSSQKVEKVTAANITDFSFSLHKGMVHRNIYFKDQFRNVLVEVVLLSAHDQYFERIEKAVKNSLSFFANEFGEIPFTNLSLIDLPRTSHSKNFAKSNFGAFNIDLISPEELGKPELDITGLIAEQYFSFVINSDKISETWISGGLSRFYGSKVYYKYYPAPRISFKIATYYPVLGINFLSYQEMPLVYTLVRNEIPMGADEVEKMLSVPVLGSVVQNSTSHYDYQNFENNTIYKPAVILQSLENILGEEKFSSIAKSIYHSFKFRTFSANDFFNEIKSIPEYDHEYFIANYYQNAYSFDYAVKSIDTINDTTYSVYVERIGEGRAKCEIALITETDTLVKIWDGKQKYQTVVFNTSETVIAAVVDPMRKNLLDQNFSNNSYTVDQQYWGSLSLAIRCFFWFQNALMVLGSIE
ncbi:MAG: hypothetical protein ABIG69_16335 [Bacteroidota bacterium]